eukprot:TRINITY_DN8600_c0_g1_i1.p1 TRINITY_DN8600_c0_g1~~TRINITY_DN8600_c0_g1_i1.p1  ORF type:complete len:1127 (+),score=258.60 TRINITY_DN8600_c0_g1_i1:49-3381(+)
MSKLPPAAGGMDAAAPEHLSLLPDSVEGLLLASALAQRVLEVAPDAAVEVVTEANGVAVAVDLRPCPRRELADACESVLSRLYPSARSPGAPEGVLRISGVTVLPAHVRQLPRSVASEQCQQLERQLAERKQQEGELWDVVAKLREDVTQLRQQDATRRSSAIDATPNGDAACERELAGMLEDAVGGRLRGSGEVWLLGANRTAHREYVTAYTSGWRQFLATADVVATGHVQARGVGAMFTTVRTCAGFLPIVAPLARGVLSAYKVLWADRRLKMRMRRVQELDYIVGREGTLRAVRAAAVGAAKAESHVLSKVGLQHSEKWRKHLEAMKEAWEGLVNTPARCLGATHLMLTLALLEEEEHKLSFDTEQGFESFLESKLREWLHGVSPSSDADAEEERFLEGLALDGGDNDGKDGEQGDGEGDGEDTEEEARFLALLEAEEAEAEKSAPKPPARAKTEAVAEAAGARPPATPPKPPARTSSEPPAGSGQSPGAVLSDGAEPVQQPPCAGVDGAVGADPQPPAAAPKPPARTSGPPRTSSGESAPARTSSGPPARTSSGESAGSAAVQGQPDEATPAAKPSPPKRSGGGGAAHASAAQPEGAAPRPPARAHCATDPVPTASRDEAGRSPDPASAGAAPTAKPRANRIQRRDPAAREERGSSAAPAPAGRGVRVVVPAAAPEVAARDLPPAQAGRAMPVRMRVPTQTAAGSASPSPSGANLDTLLSGSEAGNQPPETHPPGRTRPERQRAATLQGTGGDSGTRVRRPAEDARTPAKQSLPRPVVERQQSSPGDGTLDASGTRARSRLSWSGKELAADGTLSASRSDASSPRSSARQASEKSHQNLDSALLRATSVRSDTSSPLARSQRSPLQPHARQQLETQLSGDSVLDTVSAGSDTSSPHGRSPGRAAPRSPQDLPHQPRAREMKLRSSPRHSPGHAALQAGGRWEEVLSDVGAGRGARPPAAHAHARHLAEPHSPERRHLDAEGSDIHRAGSWLSAGPSEDLSAGSDSPKARRHVTFSQTTDPPTQVPRRHSGTSAGTEVRMSNRIRRLTQIFTTDGPPIPGPAQDSPSRLRGGSVSLHHNARADPPQRRRSKSTPDGALGARCESGFI